MLRQKSSFAKNIFNFQKAFLWESQIGARKYADDKTNDKLDLYNVLGVESNATHAEIKKAYFDLTFRYHPDRNEGNIEASQKFRKVTEAYEILGNYSMRKRYDKGLPVLFIKGKTSVRQSPVVEKEVKYQKFFDSRTSVQKLEWKNDYGEEAKVSGLKKHFDDYRTHVEEEMRKNKQNEIALALFVGVLLLLSFLYRKGSM